MSRIKLIADSFGMSVTAFAAFTGYSKQALYQALDGTNGVCTPRLKATIDYLKFTSNSIHEQDIAEARIKKNIRDKAVKELEQFLGVPDPDEGESKVIVIERRQMVGNGHAIRQI
jgi:hypothetical protein